MDKAGMVYVYIHMVEYCSAIKTSVRLPFVVTWFDPEIITLSEISQTEKGKYYITHMWNLKIYIYIHINLFTE